VVEVFGGSFREGRILGSGDVNMIVLGEKVEKGLCVETHACSLFIV